MILPLLLILQTAPAAPTEPKDVVISAAATFAVGYGIWLWEKRCHTLPADKGAAFDAAIQDSLARLRDATDAKLFGAAVGAGRETANDPKMASCTGADMAGFGEFGLSQALDAEAKLKSLPAGYHLTITD